MTVGMSGVAGRRRLWRGLIAVVWSCSAVVLTSEAAFSQGAQPCDRPVLTLSEAATLLRIDESELQQLAEQGNVPARRVGSSWRFACAVLMAWLSGDGPLSAERLSAMTGGGTTVLQDPAVPRDQEAPGSGQPAPVGEAPEEQPAEDILLRGQRVLLGRGDVVIDFGQVYSRSDDQFLVAVEEGVGLATNKQDLFATLLVGRVGVFDETELFASTAFRVQGSDQFVGSVDLGDSRRSEIGEVQFGVRRTLVREAAGRPDIIVTVDALVPTGDSPYGVGGGLVFVKSIDPVVLFAGASYRRLLDRDALPAPRPWAAHQWGLSMGYGLGLNDTLAISMAIFGSFAGSTALDGSIRRQTSGYGARFGLTSWLARGLYIEPSVSFSLNGPGNSVAFAVTLPYAF